jgi:hypothetical protein
VTAAAAEVTPTWLYTDAGMVVTSRTTTGEAADHGAFCEA